jgi:hypothetical protein
LSADIPNPLGMQFSDPFGTQHFSQTQHIPMDHVSPPQQYGQQYDPQYDQQYDPQYGQQYDPAQYGFSFGHGESSHIQDNTVEPTQMGDFIPLALGRKQRDVHPPTRIYLAWLVVYSTTYSILIMKKINQLTDILSLFLQTRLRARRFVRRRQE